MALVKRNHSSTHSSLPPPSLHPTKSTLKGSKLQSKQRFFGIVIVTLSIVLTVLYHSLSTPSSSSLDCTSSAVAPRMQVTLLDSVDDKVSKSQSLGPYVVTFDHTECCYRISASVGMDALLSIPLSATLDGGIAYVTFPRHGSYVVQLSCWWDRTTTTPRTITTKHLTIDTTAVASDDVTTTSTIFGRGAWMSAKTVLGDTTGRFNNNYIWVDPQTTHSDRKLFQIKDSKATEVIASDVLDSDVLVTTEGTISEEFGFYKFEELGNYELVCWLGGQPVHEAFLTVRPKLFPGQRPFKFHYYELGTMKQPDATWTDENKKRFRKCKQVLVSMDDTLGEDTPPLTAMEYTNQFQTFINHVTKAIHDDTFPITIIPILLEHPMNATHCYNNDVEFSSSGILASVEHPCNVAIQTLVSNQVFPSRVSLFTVATAIATPQWWRTDPTATTTNNNNAVLLHVIAMHIFVLVGKQVSDWRSVGQRGSVEGLHRNGNLEPNFELIPYEWK